MKLLEREAKAIAAHGALHGSAGFPWPRGVDADGKPPSPPTFAHGFLLPFTLTFAALREAPLREVRARYVRITIVRTLLVVVIACSAIRGGAIEVDRAEHGHRVHVKDDDEDDADDREAKEALNKWAPGAAKQIEKAKEKARELAKDEAKEPPPPPPSWPRRVWERARESWRFLLALLAFLSIVEAVITFFTRRWDDEVSFHVSALARIRPEQPMPPTPKLAADFRWLVRKAKRRARGYVLFFAGAMLAYPVQLVPTVGEWVYTLIVTLWGWYWLGVFSAAKSAHAWADEGQAPPPFAVRKLHEHAQGGGVLRSPLKAYARILERVTRGVTPAAAAFERAPLAFFGLALSRAILALPGLYFLARPIIPVAAGRLIAESDPWDRFSAPRTP